MSNEVAKPRMKKSKKTAFDTPYTVQNAIQKGGMTTKLSMLVMGLGNLAHKQIAKGIIFLAIEVAYLWFMIAQGIHCIAMLPSLGWLEQEEVWNEAKGVYEYTAGHNSIIILLYGVATIFITIGFVIMWRGTLKSAYKVAVSYTHLTLPTIA